MVPWKYVLRSGFSGLSAVRLDYGPELLRPFGDPNVVANPFLYFYRARRADRIWLSFIRTNHPL